MTAPRIPIAEAIERSAELAAHLARGGILAIPTESSYGLAAAPASVAGIAAIYRVKSRDAGKPLPVVAAGEDQLGALGVDRSSPASALAREIWPAAVSFLLPIAQPVPASAGERTLAVRVPDDAPLRALLAGLGQAVTSTSANPAGAPPLLDPERVATWLADADAIVVDAGTLAGGPPSTLVDFDGNEVRIVRAGRVSREAIESAAGRLRERAATTVEELHLG